MAANIVIVRDEKQWEIIREFLSEMSEGGIVIPPETIEKLDENMPGWEDELDSLIDYDYGGEADCWIDIAQNGNMAETAIDEFLIEVQQSQD